MSAACMVFKSMFSPTLGIVNAILGTQLGWLESRSTALYTIIILTVWMGIGLDFLLFLSAPGFLLRCGGLSLTGRLCAAAAASAAMTGTAGRAVRPGGGRRLRSGAFARLGTGNALLRRGLRGGRMGAVFAAASAA